MLLCWTTRTQRWHHGQDGQEPRHQKQRIRCRSAQKQYSSEVCYLHTLNMPDKICANDKTDSSKESSISVTPDEAGRPVTESHTMQPERSGPWSEQAKRAFTNKERSEYLDPCQAAAKLSIKCLLRNNGDKSFCGDYFQYETAKMIPARAFLLIQSHRAYRDCKQEWVGNAWFRCMLRWQC